MIADCQADELRFILPGNMLIQERDRGEQSRFRLTQLMPREPLVVKSCRTDRKLDVAVLELSTIYFDFQNLTFTDLLPVPKIPPEGTDTVMVGFPSQQARPIGANYMVIQFAEFPRVASPGNHRFANFDPITQFLLDYPASEEYDPAGFSGSGLWARKESEGLWQPNARLVGMMLGYYSRLKLIYAVSAQAIASFLGV